jgi:hypothetical protein
VVAVLGGFLFGLRAGVVLGPAAVAVLLIGANARRLLALATLALIAIPLIYLIDPAAPLQNLSFDYATHFVSAHWIAVAAVWCIAGAALLDARVLRNGSRKDPNGAVASSNSHGPEAAHSPPEPAVAERQRMD